MKLLVTFTALLFAPCETIGQVCVSSLGGVGSYFALIARDHAALPQFDLTWTNGVDGNWEDVSGYGFGSSHADGCNIGGRLVMDTETEVITLPFQWTKLINLPCVSYAAFSHCSLTLNVRGTNARLSGLIHCFCLPIPLLRRPRSIGTLP